tara:strand:+ start:674 stop:1153 length:480 start_codon:yes stop_codon:yes gene_type:complete
MIIKNNFLNKEQLLNLQNVFLGNQFNWYYQDGVVDKKDSYFQFCHSIFEDNKASSRIYFDLIKYFKKKLNIKSIIRIKANLLTKTTKHEKHAFHIDYENAKTAIFYINSNNGYTEFKNNKIVKSKENKLIIFDSNLEHRGVSCTDEKIRVVLNFNYYDS